MIKMIRPALVLSIITTVISALLIVTYNLTYVDTSGIITEAMNEKCVELMGTGEFYIVTDWKAEGYSISKSDIDALVKSDNSLASVEKLIKKDDGTIAFEIIAKGYNKDGLDLLIAMNSDGSVKGISVYKIGETPGLGTKVNDQGFLGRFSGKSGELKIVKNTPSSDDEVQAVTSATYSSKGVTKAVNTAIRVFREMGAAK